MDAGSTPPPRPGSAAPLGGPDDGTWITEQAAVRALGRTAAEIPGVWLESLRIGPASLGPAPEPSVRPPASALPPGPLRIEAALTAFMGQPLPRTAEQLSSAVLNVAAESVDLRVTDLHEGPERGVQATDRRKRHGEQGTEVSDDPVGRGLRYPEERGKLAQRQVRAPVRRDQ